MPFVEECALHCCLSERWQLASALHGEECGIFWPHIIKAYSALFGLSAWQWPSPIGLSKELRIATKYSRLTLQVRAFKQAPHITWQKHGWPIGLKRLFIWNSTMNQSAFQICSLDIWRPAHLYLMTKEAKKLPWRVYHAIKILQEALHSICCAAAF